MDRPRVLYAPVVASFDGPPARFAARKRSSKPSARSASMVRAGLHTGEVELRGEDIGGIAVHIGQEVMAQAVASA
jgi:class 3 adenylate cyclase